MGEPDFSGYATRNGIRCSDGRTIMKDAFAEQNGTVVPLVYQHNHDDQMNVLGHVKLENRQDGVYCYGFLNNTAQGNNAKELIKHGDIRALSIYANHLEQQRGLVTHGEIKEVSLVLAGANPGAYIENVTIQHGDDMVPLDDEVYISAGKVPAYGGLEHADYSIDDALDSEEYDRYLENGDSYFEHDDDEYEDESDDSDEETVGDIINSMTDKQKNALYTLIGMASSGGEFKHSDKDDSDNESDESDESDDSDERETLGDIIDTMNEKQKNITYALIAMAEKASKKNSDDGQNENESSEKIQHSEGENMHMNAFESNNVPVSSEKTLSHDDMAQFMSEAQKQGHFRDYALAHAQDYGIKNIDVLFPDAKAVRDQPDLYKRDTEWVAGVLSGTRHTPFSRIKNVYADLTEDTARAKGFTLDRDNNHRKMDEIFKVYKRITTPTTIYKKQKLDRDDVLDITTFDVVNFMIAEMRVMLDEEIARAILIGDGRKSSAEDHINEESVRPILGDDELYVIYSVADAADEDTVHLVDRIRTSKVGYMGSGMPTMFVSPSLHGELMVQRDAVGRRMYDTDASLAAALGVSTIVEVPILEKISDPKKTDNRVQAIIVNLNDYTVGTDRGGEITSFQDFDIDYNQQKYLLETRLSGALTTLKSAIVIERPKTDAEKQAEKAE